MRTPTQSMQTIEFRSLFYTAGSLIIITACEEIFQTPKNHQILPVSPSYNTFSNISNSILSPQIFQKHLSQSSIASFHLPPSETTSNSQPCIVKRKISNGNMRLKTGKNDFIQYFIFVHLYPQINYTEYHIPLRLAMLCFCSFIRDNKCGKPHSSSSVNPL